MNWRLSNENNDFSIRRIMIFQCQQMSWRFSNENSLFIFCIGVVDVELAILVIRCLCSFEIHRNFVVLVVFWDIVY